MQDDGERAKEKAVSFQKRQRDDKPSLEKGVRQNNEKKQIRKDQQYENPSFSFVLRDTKAFYSYRFVHFTIRFCDMDFVSSLKPFLFRNDFFFHKYTDTQDGILFQLFLKVVTVLSGCSAKLFNS